MRDLLPGLLGLVLLTTLASGQDAAPTTTAAPDQDCSEPSPTPERDNLVHPPGTPTVPSGSLGRLELIGHGPHRVVAFPGLGMDAETLRRLAESQRDLCTWLLVTPAGFGATPPQPMPAEGVPYRARSWCAATDRAVWDAVAALGWDRPVLLGHLDGLHHAATLALAHPDEVAGVVSLAGELVRDYGDGVTPEQRAEQIDERLARQWFRTVDEATWEAGRIAGAWFSADGEAARSWFAAGAVAPIPNQVRYLVEKWSWDRRQAFADTGVPSLALLADPAAHPDDPTYELFVDTVLNGPWRSIEDRDSVTLEVLPGARLGLVHEDLERIGAALERFLTGLDG